MMKKELIIVLALSIFIIVLFGNYVKGIESIILFNNSLTEENLTFGIGQDITSGWNENITKYLEINKFVDVINANLNISGFESEYTNHTDGFDVSVAGVKYQRGSDIAFDTRDNSFWIFEIIDGYVYHFNSSGDNQTDGFSTLGAGASNGRGITFDNTTNSFWIFDVTDNFICKISLAFC